MTDVAHRSLSTLAYVLAHPSKKLSILLMDTESNMNRIIDHADHFAPNYSVGRIQQPEQPRPSQTFVQNLKVSELADVQCYIKAYLYQICDARVEESECNS